MKTKPLKPYRQTSKGTLSVISTSCMDINLLNKFVSTASNELKENHNITVSSNINPSTFVVWEYSGENTEPNVRVDLTWEGLCSVSFHNTDLENQDSPSLTVIS